MVSIDKPWLVWLLVSFELFLYRALKQLELIFSQEGANFRLYTCKLKENPFTLPAAESFPVHGVAVSIVNCSTIFHMSLLYLNHEITGCKIT
jgi:hypothetical protein